MKDYQNLCIGNNSLSEIIKPLLKSKCGGKFTIDNTLWQVQEIKSYERIGRSEREYYLIGHEEPRLHTMSLTLAFVKHKCKWNLTLIDYNNIAEIRCT